MNMAVHCNGTLNITSSLSKSSEAQRTAFTDFNPSLTAAKMLITPDISPTTSAIAGTGWARLA